MKPIHPTHTTLKSLTAGLFGLCLAGSAASAADYFHLGGDASDLRWDSAANYSNTNGSSTAATVNPTDGTADLFFYNSLVTGPYDATFSLGATTRIYNSITFGSNAGTTQVNRDTSNPSNTTLLVGLNGGGLTVSAGAGPVTFGAGSGTTGQRVAVSVYQDLTVTNNSSSNLTFAREFDGRGAAQRAVTVAGSGSGNIIFNEIKSYDAARDVSMNINTSGTGIVQFAAGITDHNFRGATTVTAGTLVVDGNVTTSVFTVKNGGILGGSGTIANAVTFETGAQFLFDAANALTIDGAVSFGGFGIGNVAGLSSLTAEGIYNLIVGSGVIDFSNISNVGLANALDIGGGKSAYFQEGSLQLVVVPEPSSFALIVSLAASFFLIARRRKVRG